MVFVSSKTDTTRKSYEPKQVEDRLKKMRHAIKKLMQKSKKQMFTSLVGKPLLSAFQRSFSCEKWPRVTNAMNHSCQQVFGEGD